MTLAIILTKISVFIYVVMGIYVLNLNRKSPANHLFLAVCAVMAVWSFFSIYLYKAESPEQFLFWLKIVLVPNVLFYAMVLHFSLELTGFFRKRPVLHIIPFLFVIPILYGYFAEPIFINNLIWTGYSWAIIPKYSPISFKLSVLYRAVCIIISVILIFKWSKAAPTNKEKKQGRTIAVTMTVSYILIVIHLYLLPIMNLKIRGIFQLYYLIWIGGIWYSIVRYHYLKISPEMVSECILSNIDRSIILLDENFCIKRINAKTEEMIDNSMEEMAGRDIADIVKEGGEIKQHLKVLAREGHESLSCRLNYKTDTDETVVLDSNFKIVKDKFNDLVGYLMIGKEVKGLKWLKTKYKVTSREIEIINYLIQGLSNKNIAEKFDISDETVKTHMRNIYNKFIVNNKVQLLLILKEYNLIPELSGQKTIVLN
ncbi:LuxR C-terminal-related transcriptional regulator [Spirochaetota bacterium]